MPYTVETSPHKNNTLLMAGFPGTGWVGSICTSYTIEKHPFRIYLNDLGNILGLVCDSYVMLKGIHAVWNGVINWAMKNFIKEVVVMDGIPVQSISGIQDRKPMILSSRKNENNFTNGEKTYKFNNSVKTSTIDHLELKMPIKYNTKNFNALIGGTSCRIFSSCMSSHLPIYTFLVPPTSGIPDPEGVSLFIDLFDDFVKNKRLIIDSYDLTEQGHLIKKQLKHIVQGTIDQTNTSGQISQN